MKRHLSILVEVIIVVSVCAVHVHAGNATFQPTEQNKQGYQEYRNLKDRSIMVRIPAGEFLMGSEASDDEKPVQRIYLDTYYIDKYEVTNLQFCVFLNERGNQEKDGVLWLNIDSSSCLIEYQNGQYQPKSGYEHHPVIYVNWYGARAYVEWAGKRLPTEAEWEKSARGGLAGKTYPWGEGIDSQKANCDYTVGETTLVGDYPPNGYGLFDMAGNVWEWCFDGYDENYYATSSSRNPQGSADSPWRVRRGGDWMDSLTSARCANRGYAVPWHRDDNLGFRCVQSVE